MVIELGEVRLVGAVDEAPAALARSPAQRRLGRALAALALTVVAVTGSAARPPPLAEHTIVAGPGDLIFAGGDRYYVVSPGTGAAGQRTVSAYRLPDARPIWHWPLPADRIGWLTGPDGGTLLVAGSAADEDTLAVSAHTGEMLWWHGANMLGLLSNGNVLLWTSRSGEFGVGAGGRTLVALTPGSGAIRWSYEVP